MTAGDPLADELRALATPGIVVGACPAAPTHWACIDASEFDNRNQFIRRFVAEVARLVDLPDAEDVSNNLSNELRRTGTDDGGRPPAETPADLHEHDDVERAHEAEPCRILGPVRRRTDLT